MDELLMIVIDYYLISKYPLLPLNTKSGVLKMRSGPIRMEIL